MHDDKIIVYRSQAEKALDDWVWNQGGYQYLALAVLVALFVAVLFWLYNQWRKKPWE